MIPTFLTTFPATTEYKSPVKLEYVFLFQIPSLCVPCSRICIVTRPGGETHFHSGPTPTLPYTCQTRVMSLARGEMLLNIVTQPTLHGLSKWRRLHSVISCYQLYDVLSLQYLQPTGWLRVIAPLYRVIKTECTFKFTTMLSTNISISPHGSCHQWHPVKASPTSWPDQHPVCGLLIRVKIRTIKTPPASTLYCIFQW